MFRGLLASLGSSRYAQCPARSLLPAASTLLPHLSSPPASLSPSAHSHRLCARASSAYRLVHRDVA